MKLDIGGGRHAYDQQVYTVVDAYLEQPGYIKAWAWEIPLPDASVEEIFSSHMLEHVHREMVLPTLREWHRLLQPGGLLHLETPDLEYCVRTWLEAPEDHPEKWGFYLHRIFGGQTSVGDDHLTGFTLPRLCALVTEAGFTQLQTARYWSDLHRQENLVIRARP